MKISEVNVFVFIASIIVGILISLNINFSKTSNWVFMDTSQYSEAYSNKLKLINDISKLREQYDDEFSKLRNYEVLGENDAKVIQQINSEIAANNINLGKTAMQGEGIKITISDASDQFKQYDPSNITHDRDIALLLNDLKIAGAEAIAINDQRIIDTSGAFCAGAFIEINGVDKPEPFYIDAIGNKNVLSDYMLKNYLGYLKARSIDVTVEKSDDIKVPAYQGDLSLKHIKDANAKK